jgi:hypothetical protein
MANDKIILDIHEREETELDPSNKVKSIKTTGLLKVINPSAEHRLWNLKLNLAGTDFTQLKKENTKETLEPGKEWEFAYELSNIKEPILKVFELFDTSKSSEGVNSNYTVGNADESTVTISLENVSAKAIQNIAVNKTFPAYLKQLTVAKCDDGKPDLSFENKQLSWTIPSLAPGKKIECSISAKADITDKQLKSGNPVEVTYESEMAQRSELKPSIICLTDTMSGIEQEESDSKPGTWDCVIEFSNESNFELTLTGVKVLKKIATGEDAIVNLTPNAIVAPNSAWKHKFSVESAAVPSLSSKLEFTPNFTVPTKISGKIVQHPKTFTVLETTLNKEINPPIVKANANTDMKITNTLVNVGTAKIDKVKIKDLIPKDFEPPLMEQVVVSIIGATGSKVANLDKAYMTVNVSPDGKNTTEPHMIVVDCKNLANWFDPEYKLVMEYPIIARNPQPNVTYETPVETISNTIPAGPGYTDKPKAIPVIGIQYIKRKVKTMKSINPTGQEGSFNVVIKITNSGGVELENITITEEAPKAFKVGDFQPADFKPEFKELETKNTISWKIARLDPEQSVKLSYVSTGTGEYPRTEPEITFAEADSIKRDKSGDSFSKEGPGAEVTIKLKDSADKISWIFEEHVKQIKDGISFNKVADVLDEIREKLVAVVKMSPVHQELLAKSRELRKTGDKMIVGEKVDSLKIQLNEWKMKLLA